MFLMIALGACSQQKESGFVRLNRNDSLKRVDVFIDSVFFTAYIYPQTIEKPVLFPLISADNVVVSRGYPLAPRQGERIDHPHHVGLWFNYGDVNGLDFWNNSFDIPADKKPLYGRIMHRSIDRIQDGNTGILEVTEDWVNYNGIALLQENTRYCFSGDQHNRVIDRITTITAVDTAVILKDNKEGLIAMRVDRAFEAPATEALLFTDSRGNRTEVKSLNNEGVNGHYVGSSGKEGDAVWGTRNRWVILTACKNNDTISLVFFDHPDNPGYPAYAHARGYGLFSMNNLGQNVFDPSMAKTEYRLVKGQSLHFRHRFIIHSGSKLMPEDANRISEQFSSEYQ
jgi:hypothetical protein